MAETTVKFGNYIFEHGYTMVSNLLVDYQEKLGITNDDLVFILKVLRHKNGYRLHDSNLDSTLSTKTLQRRRKILVDKGYLTYTIHKSKAMDGSITTDGIVYDFTALDVALMQLSADIKEKEAKENPEPKREVIKEPAKSNVIDTLTYDFRVEYQKRYGKEYIVSATEEKKIKSLSKDEKEAIKYIFDYVDFNGDNLPENFHPRISFFVQVKWRMEKLLKYCGEKIEEEEIRKEIEREDEVARLLELEAEKKFNSNFSSEEEKQEFIIWLMKNNTKFYHRYTVSSLTNVVNQLCIECSKFKGEKDAKQTE